MKSVVVWYLLSRLTGSPVLSGILLVIGYWVVDRFTLGIAPDPVRWVQRLQRRWHLERQLTVNPHDRRNRLELGVSLVESRRYAAAVEILRPNLEAGEDDPTTLLTMGTALLGAGFTEQGEKLLAHLEETQPGFRLEETSLTLGRFRLKRGAFLEAKEALSRVVHARKGTVEGRVLLSQALVGLGDDGQAALVRDAGWAEYAAAPVFQKRKERLWAWRIKPWRPALYAMLAVVGGLIAGQALLQLQPPSLDDDYQSDE
jgi:hypothetical protein